MALGHLVLPGVGTAVAVAVSSVMSHREANRLIALCEELEQANAKNSLSLKQLSADLNSVSKLASKLDYEDDVLERVISEVRNQLFRLGYFSHLWRLLRFWIRGSYYAPDEFIWIERLDKAVLRFISTFNKV